MGLGIQGKRLLAFVATTALALGLALPVCAYAGELDQEVATQSETLVSGDMPVEGQVTDAGRASSGAENKEETVIPNVSEENGAVNTEGTHAVASERFDNDLDAAGEEPIEVGDTSGGVGAESAAAGSPSAQAPAVTASAHVQNVGWQAATAGSEGSVMLGTTGNSLRLEAARIQVAGGSVSYKCHVENVGWESSWASDGADAGSTGNSWRLEAIRIRLSDELVAAGWSVQYHAHAQDIGWMGWASDGAEAGTTGLGKRLEAVEVRVVRAGTPVPDGGGDAYRDAGLTANAHVQNVGWQGYRSGYSLSLGTHGRSLRMEALRIWRPALDVDGDVVYSAHVQNEGWQGARRSGGVAGSTGSSRRIEAITLDLTGGLADRFDVWYRLHVQNVGWMGWAHNGERAGTEGMSLRVESIQIALVPSGAAAPAADGQATDLPFLSASEAGRLSYAALVGGSWSGWAADGGTLGSESGAAFSGLRAELSGGLPGTLYYAAHVANAGWGPYAQSPAEAGGGEVQAVRAVLGGEIGQFFDVWYRGCVQGVGWMGWAKNGADAGSVGASRPLVALQMRLEPKGSVPSNAGAVSDDACLSGAGGQLYSSANATQRRIVKAANSTPWPGVGLCAGWVENVYQNAGLGSYSGNACDLYDWYCHSSNKDALKVGMIVAVRTHTRTHNGSIWGHVGIYVGDGWVMHSVTAGVKRVRLDDWIDYYGTTYTPKWGWLGDVNVA